MPRRRWNRSRAQKAGAPSDTSMLAGTLADLSARKIGDNEIYWEFFKGNPDVRACVKLIANAVAQEGYDIVPVDDDDEAEENDERFGQIHTFFRVCWIGRFNTRRKAFKVLTADQQTYGAAYIRKKYGQQDGKKTLVALERMDARYVIPHLNADKTAIDYYVLVPSKPDVAGAVQEAAQQMSQITGKQGEQIPADQVIMLSTDDGGDAVLPSPSPLEALDLTCAMDKYVRKHRLSFFENGAMMGNVFCSSNATDDNVRELQKKLSMHHAGAGRAYKNVAVGGDWKLLQMCKSGVNELDFVKSSALTTEEIMRVYGIPPGKLNDVKGGLGQAGKETDDDTFEEECVLPIEECLYETLTLEILQKEFEIDDICLVPKRRNKLRLDRFDAAMKLVKFGGSGNQALDLVGLPRVDDPEMDKPLFLGVTNAGGVLADEMGGQQPTQPGPDDVTTEQEVRNAPENTTITNEKAGAAKGANPKARIRWY